jgi:hypothetical protein
MFRLNGKAAKILETEVQRCASLDPVMGSYSAKIVLDRLTLLKDKIGKKATEEELRSLIKPYLPNFSEEALKKAASANNPSLLPRLFFGTAFVTIGGIALVWLVNLPYPMIRKPVAKVAPILLLPSYLSMDRNYRDAINNVEQADQLIRSATSAADIQLGEEKVKTAQQNLEALPVWFLGYEPVFYCQFMTCTWKFTFDEFEGARKQIARMEAIVFQEKNALTQLQTAETALETAKQNYKNATNSSEQKTALTEWKNALNELKLIPSQTWAGKSLTPKLTAEQEEFNQLTGLSGEVQQTNNIILAAKEFGKNAALLTKNPPHPSSTWEQSQNLWREAIQRLETVSGEDSGYLEAQKLLATYKTNLGQIETRKKEEIESEKILEQVESQINELQTNSNQDQNQVKSKIQSIINQLEKVKSGTTSYDKAQELLTSARNKLKEL